MLEHTGLDKLDGFGPVYVINMERSTERKQYIQEHFEKYKISNYYFVDAIDGSKQNVNDMLVNSVSPILSDGEAACSVSHIKAINQWLQESDSEYAIIAEDDVSFETVDFWDFTWKDFLSSVNKKYDILQMAIINNFIVNPRLHLREYLDWSASAYLIKRSFAEKIINRHLVDGKYVLGINRLKSLSEGLLYTNGVCYSIPLFTYSTDLGSNLNPEHVNTIHLRSKNQVLEYWKNNKTFKLDLI
jgi:hypothetical protein